MNKIFAKTVLHRNEKRIKLVFNYDKELDKKVKAVPGRIWSKSMGHIPYNKLNFSRFKDRNLTLLEKILDFLRSYYKSHRLKEYLFEGLLGGAFSAESVGRIVKKAAVGAGITKRVTAHTLRQSYVTHLLEAGVDLRYIQVLLGHSSSRTTKIYIHVSNYSLSSIKSLIDKILESKALYKSTV